MRNTLTRSAAAAAALVNSATAILVTSGSTCDQQCGNVLSSTTPADIVCDQDDYSSAAGVVFENCLNCEISSTYYTTNPNQSDQQWMLYNSRYALSECLFGEPGNESVASSPCTTSRACGPFQAAFEYGNLSTDTSIGAYDYCVDWQDSTFYDGCVNCLRDDNAQYLANMVVLLGVACDQKPALGSTVSVQGGIFSTAIMNATAPTPSSDWSNFNNSGPVSLGGKVGIAIGALCVILAITGFCIVCNGRRRRRAFLRKLEMRHKDAAGWPHPTFGPGGGGSGHGAGVVVHRGPDMNETPLSQKPLRGWDDSPQSATYSDPSYGRYFSPYSSQQTSPVNGAQMNMATHQQWPQDFLDHHQHHHHDDEHATHGAYPVTVQEQTMPDHSISSHGFPSSAQEKAMQDQHEAATQGTVTPPTHIGLALGGDEPSLRSKPSGVSAQSSEGQGQGQAQAHAQAQGQGQDGESYELYEVSSSSAGGSSAGGTNMIGSSNSFRNRVARENRAPMLQHPGYGRYSPERVLPPPPPPVHTMSGGLIDDEAKRI